MSTPIELQKMMRDPACILDSKVPKRLFITILVIVVLGLFVLSFGESSNEPRKSTCAALAGLQVIDLSELGPWRVGADGALEAIDSRSSADAKRTVAEVMKQKEAGVAITSGSNVFPKLKFIVEFSDQSTIPIRGRHYPKSARLVLEDRVSLDRTPALITNVTTWSSERINTYGSSVNETDGQLRLLVNDFVSDIKNEKQALNRN